MNHTEPGVGVVDELLRERREEAQADAEAHPLTMTREQFDARLKMLHERTLQGQAAKRAQRKEGRRAA
jgi:hypothetical protein